MMTTDRFSSGAKTNKLGLGRSESKTYENSSNASFRDDISVEQRNEFGNSSFDDVDGSMSDYLLTLTASPVPYQGRPVFDAFDVNSSDRSPGNTSAGDASFQNSFVGDYPSPDSGNVWRLANAVHMQVQENSKISTFNWNVDRSNSAATSHAYNSNKQQTRAVEGRPQQNYNSTPNSQQQQQQKQQRQSPPMLPNPSMEFFLGLEQKKGGRASANMSYANAGILKNDTTSLRFGPEVNKLPDIVLPNLRPAETNQPIYTSRIDRRKGSISGIDELKLAELTAGVNPTPLSEIKRKHSPLPQQSVLSATSPSSSTAGCHQSYAETDTPSANTAIPLNMTAMTNQQSALINLNAETDAAAIATAAALASQPYRSTAGAYGNNTVTTSERTFGRQQIQHQRTHPHHHDHLRSVAKPDPSMAHTNVTGALQNTSKQKSQYGFGAKHVVPSVPSTKNIPSSSTNAKRRLPNPPLSFGQPKMKELASGVQVLSFPSSSILDVQDGSPRPSSATSGASNNNNNNNLHQNTGAAYERKKARAKNARIMLNESIDRLAVAINMAGTQSKQRGEQLEQMRRELKSMPSALMPSSSATNNSSQQQLKSSNGTRIDNNGLHHNDSNNNVQNVMRSCADIAENARKWDRPNFIGSSASMIQVLNSQCESLMRELANLHDTNMFLLKQQQRHLRTVSASGNVSTDNRETWESRQDDDSSGASRKMMETVVCGKHVLLDKGQNGETVAKRYRIDSMTKLTTEVDGSGQNDDYRQLLVLEVTRAEASAAMLRERKIMDRITSFLLNDPTTIAICLLRVSKAWKLGECFDTDPLWRYLCTARFGFFNVRQWSETFEDTVIHDISRKTPVINNKESPDASVKVEESSALPYMYLYSKMDAANVMPYFRRQDTSIVLLGEARIPGKVSAWTFLVERSNGETVRSVLRSPEHGLSGNNNTDKKTSVPYTSLPVIQMWTIIQNVAVSGDGEPVVIRDQLQTVDSSTRRRKDEMKEIDWDDRLRKRILNLDGSEYRNKSTLNNNDAMSLNRGSGNTIISGTKELCRLRLFDTVLIETYIHAKGCSTTSKFMQRSNYTKIFVQVPTMTTLPVVIPFARDSFYLPI